MEQEVLSRTSLAETVQDLDLYKKERQRIPLEDVIEQMRQNIRIEASSSSPFVSSISFAYPDQVKAQAAVRELTAKFTESIAMTNHYREMEYRNFWQDEAAFNHAKPAPPPPMGDTVTVLDPASLPSNPRVPTASYFWRGASERGCCWDCWRHLRCDGHAAYRNSAHSPQPAASWPAPHRS